MNKIPYGRQFIDEDDIASVVEVLKSDFLTQGPNVKKFENNFASYINCNYSLAVNNATAGLHLSILALGLMPGDRVITTPITFAASANCVRYAGGEVWFADIDPNTYLIDYDSVNDLINSKPKGFFKGIIVVDFAGLPVDTEKFRKVADKNSLWIIEDSCHAPGGYYIDSHGEKIHCGSGKYCDIGVFSFHPVKHIACGEGGMITTNSKSLYEKMSLLRTHGITKENINNSHGGWYYEMNQLGYNYRLTDFQSALGISQLKKNNESLQKRNIIADRYKKAFKDIFKFQNINSKFYNAYHLFIIEVDKRKQLYDYLKLNNIFCQIHYIPIHTFPYYKKIGYEDAELSNSENYYSKCISLPMYPTLTIEEQEYIIEKVKFFYNV